MKTNKNTDSLLAVQRSVIWAVWAIPFCGDNSGLLSLLIVNFAMFQQIIEQGIYYKTGDGFNSGLA